MPASTFSTAALSSSLSRASPLDQALLYAGVLTFTSAAAYAAYSYWQRTSKTAASLAKAATGKPATSRSQLPAAPANVEYAAATAAEQITKPLDAAAQANTTPAATVTSLPAPLRTRLSTAHGILFDLDGTLVESAEIWYTQTSHPTHTHYNVPTLLVTTEADDGASGVMCGILTRLSGIVSSTAPVGTSATRR